MYYEHCGGTIFEVISDKFNEARTQLVLLIMHKMITIFYYYYYKFILACSLSDGGLLVSPGLNKQFIPALYE